MPTLGGILLVHLKSHEGLNTVYQHAGLCRRYFLAMLEKQNFGLEPLAVRCRAGSRPSHYSLIGGHARLGAALRRYVGDFVSPNGRDCAFWAHQTTWEVVDSVDSLPSRNVVAFGHYVASQGEFVAPDQLEELYMRLVAKVAEAKGPVLLP